MTPEQAQRGAQLANIIKLKEVDLNEFKAACKEVLEQQTMEVVAEGVQESEAVLDIPFVVAVKHSFALMIKDTNIQKQIYNLAIQDAQKIIDDLKKELEEL